MTRRRPKMDEQCFPFAKRAKAIRFQVRKIVEEDTQPKARRAFELEMLARDILVDADDLIAGMDLTERIELARMR